ncbi:MULTISPECIES: TDT family transporter [Kushneria]|uniref:C4-dicarboxylate ABC transporter n=2 Tax=Kushneria TaxID=504090 RepID=A0A240UQ77_9GAMM|nr:MULTISPECIES: TDT family transporter [Kushneria]ARS52513.1 C4-dicarboxylate ABC transporter [Kushneria konosiri]ART63170.1 C4-dicarboxylate ABC transporter [Kushneria marisflavi]RKD84191.1 tellurite resistance protein TehA-like permease [Kushneria marisflavi]
MPALSQQLKNAPTPMAGLALGIASLGWSWESFALLGGLAQLTGAIIAAFLLLILGSRFLFSPKSLLADLAHPVVGSVVPTFAMALMVISKSVGEWLMPAAGVMLWLMAVALHLGFLVAFIVHRIKAFELHHMVPAWFVPPVGIIVADVAFPGVSALQPLAVGLLYLGMMLYAVLLPVMIYRLVFASEIPDPAKPTIAIMAAPASLSLAGYLTVTSDPSRLLIALLGGIAVLMTLVIYLAFIKLLRLPYSPGYAAFTFPMVIGATAMAKTADWMTRHGFSTHDIAIIHGLAILEIVVATIIVGYVSLRYLRAYMDIQRESNGLHAA